MIEVKCTYCNKWFEKKPNTITKNNYCSRECYNKARGGNGNGRTIKEFICDYCGNQGSKPLSEYNRNKNHFCSKGCFYKWRAGETSPLRKRIIVNCANCGKELQRIPFDANRSKHLYCNTECMLEHRKKIEFYKSPITYVMVNCAECNNEFKIPLSKYNGSIKRNKNCNFFCSQECNNEWRTKNLRGDKSYNWKGGTTKLNRLIRMEAPYQEWRRQVFKRDIWTCQHCGYKGRNIQVHHIVPFIDIIMENEITNSRDALDCNSLYDIDNGITLCKDCHKAEHQRLRKLKAC